MFRVLSKINIQDIVIEAMAWVFIASCVCCISVLVRLINGVEISDTLIAACFPALAFPITLCAYDDTDCI